MAKKNEKTVTLEVINGKGETIHSIRGIAAKDVVKMRRDFYRILVFKLKSKVKFKVHAS